ncbi:MAG: glutathione S-transferase family protein [Pseudomonadota bacterium]
MGLLVDGQWHDQWYSTAESGGRFIRSEAQYRHWITANGDAGPSGDSGFKAEAGRYHLYISHACPWAHRVVIFRAIKGLNEHISLSVVNWYMGDKGWQFGEGPGVIPDPIHGANYLYEVYVANNSDYSGRVTVPVLWDKQTQQIVNNESSEIIRMLNSAFNAQGAAEGDYYPEALHDDIDAINARVYDTVNNGVYKCGFATTQAAYEEAIGPLFDTLEWLEDHLQGQTYLLGEQITEADWRLFTTLIRFDPVYVGHFKCNLKRLVDFPNLWRLTRTLYHHPKVAETVHFDHIKNHYYGSHESINPTRVVPQGPAIDYAL